jgi:hypothetical protein
MNTMDLAIGILGVWFVFVVLFRRRLLKNSYSIMIVFLLIFVGFHIGYAVERFGVSLKNAAIGSRVFLVYLSYFMFLDLFDDEKMILRFLKWMMILALGAITVGLINYFGPEILYHEWATEEGLRMRGGIVRAYFPAYWLVVYASLYAFSSFLGSERVRRFPLVFFFVSVGAIIFRQTRVIFGAYTLVAFFNVVKRLGSSRGVALAVLGFVALCVVVVNFDRLVILKSNIEKTRLEFAESVGSWGGRVEQFRIAWELIQEGPLFGNGTSALRSNIEAYTEVSRAQAQKIVRFSLHSDLGYAVWLKNFGFIGAVFLFILGVTLVRDLGKLGRGKQNREVVLFARNYILFVAISFVTINHLGHSDGIALFCSTMAMIQSCLFRDKATTSRVGVSGGD